MHSSVWPDHGVPETAETLVKFIRHVRRIIDKEAQHTGPSIIHCRSAYFLYLDSFSEDISSNIIFQSLDVAV